MRFGNKQQNETARPEKALPLYTQLDRVEELLEAAIEMLRQINHRLRRVEEIVSNTQTDVDTLDQEVSDIGTEVSEIITQLNTAEQQIAALQQNADPHIKQQIADLALTIQKAKDAASNASSSGGGGTPPPPPAALPLYTHDGPVDDADLAVWPKADVTEPDGTPLYHYSKDTAGQPATGDGVDGVWHLYTENTIPAA